MKLVIDKSKMKVKEYLCDAKWARSQTRHFM